MKRDRIWGYFGPYFPAFDQNTKRYGVSLLIQCECGIIWTRITPNTDTFHRMVVVFITNMANIHLSDYHWNIKVINKKFIWWKLHVPLTQQEVDEWSDHINCYECWKIVIQYLHFAFKINQTIINVTRKLNPFSNFKSAEN